ncbi:MAG: hypothetical protein WC969_00880 [Elusimicrobiota bacterium]|jgi:hypothetical protein
MLILRASILTVTLLLLMGGAARAEEAAASLDGHPVMRALLERGRAGLNAPCAETFKDELTRMPFEEATEAAFVLKDMLDSSCRVALLGVGRESFVPLSPEQSDRELSDPAMARALDAHSHPAGNGAYFGEGGPYAGEIMFASESAIAERRLPKELYEQALSWVREGRIPGFNMSPPSIQDFLSAGANARYNVNAPGRVTSLVLTSGGAWTYVVDDETKANETLYNLVAYANVFEAANSSAPPPRGAQSGRKERAQALFGSIAADPVSGPLVEGWAGASLALRAPYTAEALNRFQNGDDAGIREEAAAKQAEAERFCALLRTMGIRAAFTPRGQNLRSPLPK